MHRTPDKQTIKTPSRTPLKETANTLPVRRDDGSGKNDRWEEGGEEYRNCGGEGKRENARSRCFEMRVNNISSINDKIYGLLSLIKRDKIDEALPRTQADRAPLTGKHAHSTYNASRQDVLNKERYQAYVPKVQTVQGNLNTRQAPANYNFTREIKVETNPEYIYKKSYEYTPKNQTNQPKTPLKYTQNISAKPQKSVSKRSYLPAEYNEKPMLPLTPKGKNAKNQFQEEQIEYQRYEIKIERRNDDYTPPKQRRAQPEAEQMLRQKEEKPPKAESVRPEPKAEKSKFQNITIQPQKRHETNKNSTSYALPSSIPKPQASNFKPIALSEQSTRAQKLNTTTKLIDEQIKRIKCKIEESENHSQWMNSKLQRQREDRNSVSQTYIQEENDSDD